MTKFKEGDRVYHISPNGNASGPFTVGKIYKNGRFRLAERAGVSDTQFGVGGWACASSPWRRPAYLVAVGSREAETAILATRIQRMTNGVSLKSRTLIDIVSRIRQDNSALRNPQIADKLADMEATLQKWCAQLNADCA